MKPMWMLVYFAGCCICLNTKKADRCCTSIENSRYGLNLCFLMSWRLIYSAAADEIRRTQSQKGLWLAESQRSNRGQQTLYLKSELLQGNTLYCSNMVPKCTHTLRIQNSGV